jgi:hypothetical protein
MSRFYQEMIKAGTGPESDVRAGAHDGIEMITDFFEV